MIIADPSKTSGSLVNLGELDLRISDIYFIPRIAMFFTNSIVQKFRAYHQDFMSNQERQGNDREGE